MHRYYWRVVVVRGITLQLHERGIGFDQQPYDRLIYQFHNAERDWNHALQVIDGFEIAEYHLHPENCKCGGNGHVDHNEEIAKFYDKRNKGGECGD